MSERTSLDSVPSYVKSLSVDCSSGTAATLAGFWAAVLGGEVDEDATGDKAFLEAPGWGGPNLWFTAVPGAEGREEPGAPRPAGPDGDVAAEVAGSGPWARPCSATAPTWW